MTKLHLWLHNSQMCCSLTNSRNRDVTIYPMEEPADRLMTPVTTPPSWYYREPWYLKDMSDGGIPDNKMAPLTGLWSSFLFCLRKHKPSRGLQTARSLDEENCAYCSVQHSPVVSLGYNSHWAPQTIFKTETCTVKQWFKCHHVSLPPGFEQILWRIRCCRNLHCCHKNCRTGIKWKCLLMMWQSRRRAHFFFLLVVFNMFSFCELNSCVP